MKSEHKANLCLTEEKQNARALFFFLLPLDDDDDDDDDNDSGDNPQSDNENHRNQDKSPTCKDYILHFLSFFWKFLFAFVPPTSEC